jgi:hypothetical protein
MAGVELAEKDPSLSGPANSDYHNEFHVVVQRFPMVPVAGLVEVRLLEGDGLHVPQYDPLVAENGNGDQPKPPPICVPVKVGPVAQHTYV